LSNIKNISELPFIDYLNHGIPIALSTDGHGAYDTQIILEDKNAYIEYLKNKESGAYIQLTAWEDDYVGKKLNK
jgi:adenosine deaminase